MIFDAFDMGELGAGMVGFRTFEFGLRPRVAGKQKAIKFSLPSPTRIGAEAGLSSETGDPNPDWFGDNGKKFCSMFSVANAANCSDYEFAKERNVDDVAGSELQRHSPFRGW